VFSDQKVLDRLEKLNVLLIQADNTDKLQSINDDLKRYGRANLPVNLVVPANPDAPIIVMPEIFGPEEALQALEEAVALSKK
jgi:thiol:disulfide interchange protein